MFAMILMAQAQAFGRNWNFGEIAIGIIIFFAIVACVYAYLSHAGIGIPPLLVKLFWIVVGAALAIIAIRFLMSL